MTEKQRLLNFFEREFPMTIKVMEAYPQDKMDFKPHDRSNSAMDLFRTFVIEANAMSMFAQGIADWNTAAKAGEGLETKSDYMDAFKTLTEKVKETVNSLADEDLLKEDLKVSGQIAQSRLDAIWFLANDNIHHRGQLSVYVRMAGGKVPAIYGPSADDRGGF
jgi:uncharacterized damage-inducible protein DinB